MRGVVWVGKRKIKLNQILIFFLKKLLLIGRYLEGQLMFAMRMCVRRGSMSNLVNFEVCYSFAYNVHHFCVSS